MPSTLLDFIDAYDEAVQALDTLATIAARLLDDVPSGAWPDMQACALACYAMRTKARTIFPSSLARIIQGARTTDQEEIP